MEFLKKSRGLLPCDAVLKIFYQACRAVQHMHRQKPPIIHRDLKVPRTSRTPVRQHRGVSDTRVGASEQLRQTACRPGVSLASWCVGWFLEAH